MAQSFMVVGAHGGVGEALCRRLARRGARELMAGRDPGKLAQLAADIRGETVALDATEPDQVEVRSRV
jgi:NADP-dependent 3-hydroxy acid dehydrogenase YdfG